MTTRAASAWGGGGSHGAALGQSQTLDYRWPRPSIPTCSPLVRSSTPLDIAVSDCVTVEYMIYSTAIQDSDWSQGTPHVINQLTHGHVGCKGYIASGAPPPTICPIQPGWPCVNQGVFKLLVLTNTQFGCHRLLHLASATWLTSSGTVAGKEAKGRCNPCTCAVPFGCSPPANTWVSGGCSAPLGLGPGRPYRAGGLSLRHGTICK